MTDELEAVYYLYDEVNKTELSIFRRPTKIDDKKGVVYSSDFLVIIADASGTKVVELSMEQLAYLSMVFEDAVKLAHNELKETFEAYKASKKIVENDPVYYS